MTKKDTRTHIIQKSAELFNRYGYSGCSLSDIMQATDLKKGGIYNHFKSKEEIALAAYDYSFNQVLAKFRRALDQVDTAWDKLQVLIDVYASFVTDKDLSGGCPIFNTAVDAQNAHPHLKVKARESIAMLQRYIELKVEEGVRNKEFTAKVPASEIAMMLIVTIEGAIIYANANENLASIEVTTRYCQDLLTRNLIKE